jgi:SAM-dependent methyltransferase
MAREHDADLIGVDPSTAGLLAARERAVRLGVADRSRFEPGTFQQTGLSDACADTVMTIEAFQYAPDKRAACAEIARILRPGGRFGIVCFEVDPVKAAGLPVLGVDPVPDYTPVLDAAGFAVEVYEETPGWEARVYGAFAAVVTARDALEAEMGPDAAASALAEALATVELRPYPRRVLIAARRR